MKEFDHQFVVENTNLLNNQIYPQTSSNQFVSNIYPLAN